MNVVLHSDKREDTVLRAAEQPVSFLASALVPKTVVVDWEGRTWDAGDESTLEIVRSNLLASAQTWCLQVISAMRSGGAVDECVAPTNDGGMTLEFTRDDREITFVVPEDASVRYFVARAKGDFRRAGVIAANAAITAIAAWLRGGVEFPQDGVVVANRSASRR